MLLHRVKKKGGYGGHPHAPDLLCRPVMDSKYLQTLELPKILSRLAEHTSFSAGRELALRLRPSSVLAEVRRRQGETSEARRLLALRGDLSLGGAHDVRPLVKNARREAVLLPAELLNIRDTLVRGRTLRRAILRLRDQFPLLAGIAARIEECPRLVSEIARCINERAEVVDGASPELARIRRELRETHRRLLDKLERIISSPSTAPFLQEPLITQREGRYVIPLKADFKGRIPGLVHDVSASGATLFIEPLATLELGNRWRELQVEEEQEVRRVLAALSSLVAEEGERVERTVEALAELDLAFAKARYAEELRAVEPKLVPWKASPRPASNCQHPGSTIDLRKARHPLLNPATVVPIDVHLSDDYFILVITGPNTGGKTVSLKTVGLLALMAQCGLHIPAAEGSALSVFSGIYADIGDEQSIEQNLSTFSSHLNNIVDILRRADKRSLVLLDELGAGTDPSEGSALARAILSHLLKRRITTFVATHYPELKVFAHATPGVENACVEFDLETLAPTYELSIGLPGRSNALAIASRLGLTPEIVDQAREMISPENLEVEGLLAEIQRARQEALEAREAAEAARREAESLERELRQKLAAIEEDRREVLRAAREEARRELEEVREELRKIKARLKAAPVSREWLAQAEKRLAELEPPPVEPPPRLRPGEPVGVGDAVWVAGLGAAGEVIALDGDEAEVQVGRFRVRARLNELEKVAGEWHPTPTIQQPRIIIRHPSPGLELRLRGWRVEEALERLEKYLNDAYLAGLPFVRVIHGKGTGVLRRAVREHLSSHPLVAEWRPGEEGEGGNGVTVVRLVPR